MRIQHWQDAASLAVGVWLVLSPWPLGTEGAAAGITLVLGVAVALVAIEALLIPSWLEEWTEIGLGLALMIAPWAVGYGHLVASLSSLASGVAVIVFAVWEMTTDHEFANWWHDHWHHPST